MASEYSEVEFLKDQVHRLNAALSQYQRRYPPPDDKGPEEDSLSEHGPRAPWLYDRKLLIPLLLEYDHTIHQLTDQVNQYKSEFAVLQASTQQVVAENNKLNAELRRVLELHQRSSILLKQQKRSSRLKGSSDRHESYGDVETLQKLLDATELEREENAEKWQKASEQAIKLQTLHQAESRQLKVTKLELQEARDEVAKYSESCQELLAAKQALDSDYQRCLDALHGHEDEMTRMRSELQKYKKDLRYRETETVKYRDTVDDLRSKMSDKDKGARAATKSEHSMKSRISQLEMELSSVDSRLLSSQRNASALQQEKSELETFCLNLRRQIEVAKQQENDVIAHVRDAMQVVENTLLERDQALVRESQKAQEAARLQEALSLLMAEAGEKTRQEVMAVKEQCNRNIGKLMDEMQKAELELAQKHTALEKTTREKKSLEKEFEKILQEKPASETRLSSTLDELRGRMCAAERSRDEMQLKVNSVAAQSRQKEISFEQDKSQLETRVADVERRLASREHDCEEMREERIRLIGDIEGYQHQLKLAEQAREAAERKCVREALVWQQKQDLKEKELTQRLEGSGEVHRKTSQELRHLLSSQQRIGAKWREESRALAAKFEKTVTEMKTEIARHRQRSEELSYELNTASAEKEDHQRRAAELSNAQSRLKRIIAEVEGRASAASRQVSVLLSREKQLLEERKALHRELDRLKLRSSRKVDSALGDWEKESFLDVYHTFGMEPGERDGFEGSIRHHSTALDLDAIPRQRKMSDLSLSERLSVADHE